MVQRELPHGLQKARKQLRTIHRYRIEHVDADRGSTITQALQHIPVIGLAHAENGGEPPAAMRIHPLHAQRGIIVECVNLLAAQHMQPVPITPHGTRHRQQLPPRLECAVMRRPETGKIERHIQLAVHIGQQGRQQMFRQRLGHMVMRGRIPAILRVALVQDRPVGPLPN